MALTGAVLALAAPPGCAELLSIDDFQNAVGGQSTAVGGAGGAAGGLGGEAPAGSGPGSEYCLDGIDNDSDGKADCLDEECASYECAPRAPSEWQRVGWLYPAGSTPGCGPDERMDLYAWEDAFIPPPACSCVCPPPTGTNCRADYDCSITGCGDSAYDSGQATLDCGSFPIRAGTLYCQASGLSAVAGTCTPSANVVAEAPEWQPSAALCHYDSGICGAQEICVPAPRAGATGPCVEQEGNLPCPTAYPDRHEYWNGTTLDGRSCSNSSCACAPPQGAQCACMTTPCGVRDFYPGDSNCTSPHGLGDLESSTCSNWTGISPPPSPASPSQLHVRLVGVTVTDPGSCEASGTAYPTGAVTPDPAGAITVCCARSPGSA